MHMAMDSVDMRGLDDFKIVVISIYYWFVNINNVWKWSKYYKY